MNVFKLCLCIVLLMCSLYGSSQGPATENAVNTITGRLYGKILDISSGKPIDGATVQLIGLHFDAASNKSKNITLITQLSDKKGEFNLENLSVSTAYSLRISAAGYKVYEAKANFDVIRGVTTITENIANNANKDIGNIRLVKDEQLLQNVTVLSSSALLQLDLDKKVYNVEKDISATGGTALDIMKNVPSVNVDIDGNVTFRNAAPQVFVDGRPTTLTLDQIPADQVATVEIMTNPSAKYDASGGGSGILNIVLKKNRKRGYNGAVRAGIDSRGKPGVGGDMNIKVNKINFFASGSVTARRSVTTVRTSRTDILQDGTANYIQTNKPVNNNIFAFGRLGIDYFMDNRNTLSVSGNIAQGDFKVKDYFDIYKDTITTSTTFNQTANRTLKVAAGFKNLGSSIGFKHNFARSGREWTADATFSYNKNDNTSDYNNTLYDGLRNQLPAPGAQRATGGGNSLNYTLQTDYTDPVSETQKIELGARSSFRTYNNLNDNYLQDMVTMQYILLPNIGVRYKYSDRVIAAYGSYSRQIKDFSYQAGIRIESSSYEGNFFTKNEQFSNKYPFSFFPSVFLTNKLNEKEDIQLNYSRRINRPNFSQLVPFVDFSDSLNLSVGNPSLRPEFTHLVEFAYSNQYNVRNVILASLYGKRTNDLITRYQFIDSVINPSKPARYTSFANANSSFTVGLELTAKNRLSRWWDINSNLNLFNVNIKAGNLVISGKSSQFSWFAKLINSFKLPSNFSIQFSGDYQAKTILPAGSPGGRNAGAAGSSGSSPQTTAQGYLNPTYGADIAVKKDFFKNNSGSLTVQFTDIFRTRVYSTHASTADFTQDNRRYRDPQLLRLNFNWRFGKFDATVFKRKNTKGDQENLQSIQNGNP